MKKISMLKKLSAALLLAITGLILTAAPARASQCSIPYQGDNTQASPVPAFNVFCGPIPSPAPTDGEQDFFQGRVPVGGNLNDPNTPFTNPLSTTCVNGQILQLHIYVHNGASADNNNNGTGPSVAHNSKVTVALPSGTATSFDPTATISASNAASVSDDLNINCNGQNVQLQYIEGSASQYALGTGVVPLSDSIVTSGASIRSEQVPGDVWGCWNERVYVVLAVKVVVPPAPQVTAACNVFTVEANSDRQVTVNQFNFTASNANFKSVVINWGDNNSDTITDSSKVIGTTHTYASPGTYDITALIDFAVNGQSDIKSGGSGSACAGTVTFLTTPTNVPPTVTTTTPSATPAPTQLVNTGPGSTAAIIGGVSAIAGTIGYRQFLRRKQEA